MTNEHTPPHAPSNSQRSRRSWITHYALLLLLLSLVAFAGIYLFELWNDGKHTTQEYRNDANTSQSTNQDEPVKELTPWAIRDDIVVDTTQDDDNDIEKNRIEITDNIVDYLISHPNELINYTEIDTPTLNATLPPNEFPISQLPQKTNHYTLAIMNVSQMVTLQRFMAKAQLQNVAVYTVQIGNALPQFILLKGNYVELFAAEQEKALIEKEYPYLDVSVTTLNELSSHFKAGDTL